MKKLIVAIVMILPLMAEATDLKKIQAEWKSKVITDVPTGGLAIMLERFDMTWSTAAVGDVCQVMQMGVSKIVLDDDDGYTVEVDAKNGFVESYNAGSDRQYMQACVWRRSNGHRLFAVVIGQPVDPEIEIICFYDYNPKKQTLTPEPNAIGDWLARTERGDYSFRLPQEGKELLIFDNLEQIKHHFQWDGMRPVFDYSEQINQGAAADGKGLAEEWDVSVRTTDLDSNPRYEVIIRDSNGKTMTFGERTGYDYPRDMLETFGDVWQTDIDFDGHTDVLICLGREPVSDQTFVRYDAWLYNPDDGKFYCPHTFRDICNPEIDREETRILSHYIARDGKTRVYSAHYWQRDGNILPVGESWTVTPNN